MAKKTSSKEGRKVNSTEQVLRESRSWIFQASVGLCKRYGLPDSIAEDLAQDTLLEVLGKGEMFLNTLENPRGMIYKILKDNILTAVKLGERVKKKLLNRNPDARVEAIPDDCESPLCMMFDYDEFMNNMADQLELDDYQLLQLRSQGKRYKEIATIMGISVAAAKTRLFRLRPRIKDALFAHIETIDNW